MRGSTTVALTQYNVETIVDNAKDFTPHQIRLACAACRLQCMTGHPSDADLSALLRCNMLKNCPIAAPNISIAKLFYGPDIVGVSRGKGVRRPPCPVISGYVAVPPHIRELN